MYGQYSMTNPSYPVPFHDVVMHELSCESPRSVNMNWIAEDAHCSLAQSACDRSRRVSIWDVHMMTPPPTPPEPYFAYRRGMAMSICTPSPTLSTFRRPERLQSFTSMYSQAIATNYLPLKLSSNVPVAPDVNSTTVSFVPFPSYIPVDQYNTMGTVNLATPSTMVHAAQTNQFYEPPMDLGSSQPGAAPTPPLQSAVASPSASPPPLREDFQPTETIHTSYRPPTTLPSGSESRGLTRVITRTRANALLSRIVAPAAPASPPPQKAPRAGKGRVTKKSPLCPPITLPSIDANVITPTTASPTVVGTPYPTSAYSVAVTPQMQRTKIKPRPRLGLSVQPPVTVNVGMVPVNGVTSPISPPRLRSPNVRERPPQYSSYTPPTQYHSQPLPHVESPPSNPSAGELALLWAEMERFKNVPLPLDNDFEDYAL